jgi:dethiobiotin synthetase
MGCQNYKTANIINLLTVTGILVARVSILVIGHTVLSASAAASCVQMANIHCLLRRRYREIS